MRRRPGGREAVPFFAPYLTGRAHSGRTKIVLNHDPVITGPFGSDPESAIGDLPGLGPLSVLQEDVVASELVTQCLNQVVGRVDPPGFTELQQGARVTTGVFQLNRAGPALTATHLGHPTHAPHL